MVGATIAWMSKRSDDQVWQCFVFEIAIAIVYWIVIFVFHDFFIAKTVYHAVAFFVVGA